MSKKRVLLRVLVYINDVECECVVLDLHDTKLDCVRDEGSITKVTIVVVVQEH